MLILEEKALDSLVTTLSLIFRDSIDEPMDGDKVEDILKYVRAFMNYNEGNITQLEFDETIQELEDRRYYNGYRL